MEKPTEIIAERREALMVSSDRNPRPTLRTAYFLNPTHASIEVAVPKNPSLCLSSLPENIPVNVIFNGWKDPTANWKSWVYHMEDKYRSVWKKAGIYEAVMSSTCRFKRDDGLITGLAEKWCPETNTFIFPWAEATITLEDVMILGGYSVLGSPAFLSSLESRELEEIHYKLKEARTELGRRPARKACQNGWMKMFMNSGSEIEHEAFLSLWLERYVFKDSEQLIKTRVFPIAIHLAKGELVALGPAVLASIYRDLGLLKATILAATEFGDALGVTLWSPFHLVQLWAWERFAEFQPKPNVSGNGKPRSALWDEVNGTKVVNFRLALDSAAEAFCWRPYATGPHKSHFLKFCKEKEEWQDLGSNQDLLSFAICLRVSELVGLDCIEQYLPHRVARQFGFDQDIPCDIARLNEIPEVSWINYIRPFNDTKLFFPSQFFEPDVTVQYLEWWKQSVLGSNDLLKDAINTTVRRKRNLRKRSERVPWASVRNNEDDNADVLSSPPAKYHMPNIEEFEDSKPTIGKQSCSIEKTVAYKPSVQKGLSNAEAKQAAIGESAGALEDAIDCKPVVPNCRKSGGETGAHTFEVPGLALESRIAKLERAIAELKASRIGCRFGRN
ncbi:hypothetical protein JCGZ_00852 [Jatropha curcas]|uniref:Aminotransferase-like plant mobile domain-containing protein n=1 Tax=Jatropha curcas TaxID=180498 RepID=A0A067L3L9_JATCU|nr:uncharacterized protein LOC105632924 [Jatropha curcas]KDP39095.1 hypothetical protein JCGZ_00852 [Jatropha curcas]